jgi:cellobiose-specific phosphotransferase system component IIA
MAKPTISRSRDEPWTPEARDQIIDKLIGVAGELPAGKFEIQKWEKGTVVIYSGSAREKLHIALKDAEIVYRSDVRRRLHSAKQLLAELRRIESAAQRLLKLVGKDASAINSTFGLAMTAHEEGKRLDEALRQTGFMTDFMTFGSWAPFSRGRLEKAIKGIEGIHRWAEAAAEQNLRRVARMQQEKDQLGQARHKGNIGLNQYIEAMVEMCWSGVWGRRISDGPKLWKFVKEAAASVDVGLSEEASRERIRRIFGLRRANRSGLNLYLPNLQTSARKPSKHGRSASVKRS